MTLKKLAPKLVVVALIFLVISCSKQRERRLTNKWKRTSFISDGEEYTSTGWLNYYEFKENGSYIINIPADSISTIDIIGTWKFTNDKKNKIITTLPEFKYRNMTYTADTVEYELNSLRKKSMKLTRNLSSGKELIHCYTLLD
jgi:hypothetical protein